MSDQEKNKVIAFPIEKVRERKTEHSEVSQSRNSFKSLTAISGSAILMIFAFVNALISSEGDQKSQERGIASLSSLSMTRDTDWEHSLASRLADPKYDRGIASVGRAPTLQEEFVAQMIHNKYSVKVEDGRVVSIHFLAQNSDDVSPLKISPVDYLLSHRDQFGFSFKSVAPHALEKYEDHQVNLYSLNGDDPASFSQAKVELDNSGRLLSVNFSSK